jgi:hypothetical protein
MKSTILFIENLKWWQVDLGFYLLFSVSMGAMAFLKKPRRVWLEEHPEDRKPNE